MPDADEQAGLERLREDLESGAWRERHRDLAELDALDVGFRLLVAPAAGAAARDA
jgi:hypothetical protein